MLRAEIRQGNWEHVDVEKTLLRGHVNLRVPSEMTATEPADDEEVEEEEEEEDCLMTGLPIT